MIRIEHSQHPQYLHSFQRSTMHSDEMTCSWNEKSKLILYLVLAKNTKNRVAFLLNAHTQLNVLSLGCILLTLNTTYSNGVLQQSQVLVTRFCLHAVRKPRFLPK